MSWGVAAAVGGAALGAWSSSRASKKAAKAQRDAGRESSDVQERMFHEQMDALAPYRNIGEDIGIPGLQRLSTDEGRNEFLGDYYSSNEFDTLNSQSMANQLAASEATGQLGGSANQNNLARIAPTLGLNALNDQRELYGQLANIGQAGAGAQAGYAGNFGNNMSNIFGQMGAASAGNALNQGRIQSEFANQLGGIGMNMFGGAKF